MKRMLLEVINGPNRGKAVTVGEGEELVVGRAASSALAIMDPRMSRRHFALCNLSDGLQVKDLASSNGTMVNDQKIAECLVQPGDVIVAGDTSFRVGDFERGDVEDQAPDPEAAPEASASRLRTWTED
jgi:pSer/pThr/pTyr-binding forkhead associated (FHA) protein